MLPCTQALFEKSGGLLNISDHSSQYRTAMPRTEATHLSGVRIGHCYVAQPACAGTLASWQLRRRWGLFCWVRSHLCWRLVQGFCQRSDWETHGCANLQYEAFGDMKEIYARVWSPPRDLHGWGGISWSLLGCALCVPWLSWQIGFVVRPKWGESDDGSPVG